MGDRLERSVVDNSERYYPDRYVLAQFRCVRLGRTRGHWMSECFSLMPVHINIYTLILLRTLHVDGKIPNGNRID